MDIILERILSLIPKKENGDFKHGALAGFARSIGFKDGHIISDWIAGNSESYKNYLYQISAIHNVSVEWLKGETDEKEKNPTPEGAELDPVTRELFEIVNGSNEDELKALLEMARLIKKRRDL